MTFSQSYRVALQNPRNVSRCLIKFFSLSTSIQGKADSTYKDMDDWLGERFLQEVER